MLQNKNTTKYTPTRLSLGDDRAVSVSVGSYHNLALAADGAVWSWGHAKYGILGHGDEQHRWQPTKVEALAGQRGVAVFAQSHDSLALTADGAAWSWGRGALGKLGHGDEQQQLLPKKVEALAGQRVVAVEPGYFHSIALAADGAVWSWGGAGDGKLGHGDNQRQLLPKQVEALAGQRVIAVSAGGSHSLALTADAAVFTWGKGESGCLGHGGDLSSQLLPKKVEAWAPGQ